MTEQEPTEEKPFTFAGTMGACELFGMTPYRLKRWIAEGKLTRYTVGFEGMCSLPEMNFLPRGASVYCHDLTLGTRYFHIYVDCQEVARLVKAEVGA